MYKWCWWECVCVRERESERECVCVFVLVGASFPLVVFKVYLFTSKSKVYLLY